MRRTLIFLNLACIPVNSWAAWANWHSHFGTLSLAAMVINLVVLRILIRDPQER